MVAGKSEPVLSPGLMGCAFTTKLPMATSPTGGRFLGLPRTGAWRGFHVGRTPPAVGFFQGCLLTLFCFLVLNILEAGGLQIALLEKADRKPCQFYFICLILIMPWGWPGYKALIYLVILQFSLLLLYSF